MAKKVVFSEYGAADVLQLVDAEIPEPEAGQVRVRVQAAGLNPLDFKLFGGMRTSTGSSAALPSGNGQEFAGVVDALGAEVTTLAVGDNVYGSLPAASQASFLVVPAAELSIRPEGVSVEQAAALHVVSRTAAASVAAINPGPDDTVLVSAAAGGVGIIASQLALRTGATVIGTASEGNHEFLRSLGVIPVTYGEGAADRIRAVAPQGVTAALDNQGRESVLLALELGVPGTRINTIADYDAPREFGASLKGSAASSNADRERVAQLIADGEITLPIDSIYPLDQVQAAYTHLLARHIQGKVVLTFP